MKLWLLVVKMVWEIKKYRLSVRLRSFSMVIMPKLEAMSWKLKAMKKLMTCPAFWADTHQLPIVSRLETPASSPKTKSSSIYYGPPPHMAPKALVLDYNEMGMPRFSYREVSPVRPKEGELSERGRAYCLCSNQRWWGECKSWYSLMFIWQSYVQSSMHDLQRLPILRI